MFGAWVRCEVDLTLRHQVLPPLEAVSLFIVAAQKEPGLVWLDSSLAGGAYGRWSYLMRSPVVTLTGAEGRWRLHHGHRDEEATGDPFDLIERMTLRTTRFEPPLTDPPPFTGGAVGFLGYGLAPFAEPTLTLQAPPPPEGDLWLGWYDHFIAIDHETGRVIAVASSPSDMAELIDWAAAAREIAPPASVEPPSISFTPDTTPDDYRRAVDRVREYIAAGDVYQVNLSQRFLGVSPLTPADAWLSLRQGSPAPYGAYIGLAEGALLSTSPERFLVVDEEGKVESRPIKGTAPRGATPEEDRAQGETLVASEKDRAENVMIVDLIRNDLSRVCAPGSVEVPSLCQLERFATVLHLTSTVTGALREGIGFADLMRATFPCGSVTGAPKIRAMEIIDELEPAPRGAYCGAIGWLGRNGAMEWSVAIRIALNHRGEWRYHTGGGITWPSTPDGEYQETLVKGEALREGLGG